MATGSNELNLLLKSKVVKVKVELDVKGSGLLGQVDGITRFLKDKRVKLKVELDTTGLIKEVQKLNTYLSTNKNNVKLGVELKYNAKDINKQINEITTAIKNSKTGLSDLKIGVSIDVKGTATKIKAQLAEINKVIKEFNANYAKQIKDMQGQAQKIGSGGSKSSSSAVVADMNLYAKSLKDAQKYMTGQFGKGLFSSTELKDANGVLTGFVGTLTKANGVVQKIRYEWDSKANSFTPINQQTITSTEKNVATALKSLRELDTEISKLGKNQNKFWQESNALRAKSGDGTLTQQAVNDLKLRIKEEQTLQTQIKNENDLLRMQKQLLAEIKREQGKAKSQGYKDELGGLKNSVSTVQLDDTMAKGTLNNLKASLAQIKQSYADNINREKELINASEKRKTILAEIARIEKSKVLNSSAGTASKRYIDETKVLAKNIKSMEDYIKVKQRMDATNRELKSMKIDNSAEKQLEKLRTAMMNYATATGKSLSTIETRFAQVSHAVKGNLDGIANEVARYSRMTEQFRARQALEQKKNSVVDFGGTKQENKAEHTKVRQLVDAKDNQALKEYIANLNGANVAMMKLTTDSKGVSRITAQFESTKKTAKEVVYEIDNVDKKLRQLSTAEVFNANRNLGVFEQLKIAMARVPVWMVAMTAFHGSINTVQQVTSEILKLDKAMTQLARVADSQISIDHMFEGALQMSKELGNNIHDVMGSVNELARTFGHFNERQLLAITHTATLMSNVSDLSAQEATESLVGTMNAFNITAEDSVRIVDSMNEVDNNYAISTKQLATGLAKSASTAKTFGVEMEQNIGHITAIGAVTMESGNIIGNSLKTIYSRITTMNASKEVLEGVGIAMTDMTGDTRDVSEIIDELGGKWHTLSKSQQQNIAVTVAGRYQLSRFLALMNNYEMAQESISTAYNSQGSAMRENAKYLESFEARINSMKNGFTELAVAIGEAFLSGGLSLGIEALTNLAGVAVSVVDSFGVLPVVLGIVSVALMKFGVFSKLQASMVSGMGAVGTAFKTSTATINGATVAMTRFGAVGRTALNGVTAGVATARTAITGLGITTTTVMTAIKGAIASTGILVGFLALGWVIEKLIGHFNDLKMAQEELEKTNQTMIDSYRASGDGMQSMYSEYEKLANKKKDNIDLTEEESQRLDELTRQFAEQLPTVVEYHDANGEAILQSTTAIKEQIKAVADLSREQAKLKDMKLSENIKEEADAYADVAKDIEKTEKKIADLKDTTKNNKVAQRDDMGFVIYDDGADAIKAQELQIELMGLEGKRRESMSAMTKLIQEQTVANLEANGSMVGFGDNQQKLIEKFVTYNDGLLITAERNGNLAEASENLVVMTKEVANVFTSAYDIMSKDLDTSELEGLRTQLEAVSASVPEDFLKIDAENPVASLDKITHGMKEIINVGTHVRAGSEDFDYLSERLEATGMSSEEASEMLSRLGAEYSNSAIRSEAMRQSVDGVTSSLDTMTESAIEAVNPIEQLFGYETGDMSAVKSHLETMELLYQAQGKSAEENMKFMDSQQALADFFNTTPDDITENIHTYNLLADAIGKVKVATDEQGGSYLDLSEATSGLNETQRQMLETWINSGGKTSIFTGELLDVQDELNATSGAYDQTKTEMSEPFKFNVDTTAFDKLVNDNPLKNVLNWNRDASAQLSGTAGALSKTLSDVKSQTGAISQINTDLTSVKSNTDELKEKTVEASTVASQSFDSMKNAVNNNTSIMITKHSEQRTELQRLAGQATLTNTAISNMNSNASNALTAISRYQSKLNGFNSGASSLLSGFTPQSITGESYSGVAQSISTFSATAEGVASSMASGGEGSSGVIRQSAPIFEALHGTSGASTYANKSSTSSSKSSSSTSAKINKASTTAKKADEIDRTAKELAELYVIDLLERKKGKYQSALGQLEAKISGLSENTHKYRVAMLEAQKYESLILEVNKEDLVVTQKRNAEIEKRLSLLANTSKHTAEQREEYNKLQQEYDSNLSSIQSLQVEIENTIIELRKKTEEIFIDFIEDIVGTMDEALTAITDRIDNVDFELEVLELTDPDNSIAKIDLMAEKVRDLTKQQEQYVDYQNELEEKIRYATSKYGAQSDAVKTLVSQMKQYKESWEDVTLEILRTEKEIREMRGAVADDLIDSFKGHFETIQKQSEDTSNIEIENAKRAHDAKMKLYDDESKRISELYDQRIKALDDAYNAETYEEEVSERNNELSELKEKAITYSGDTSIEGRKKSAEIEDEVAKKQKELDDFVKKNKLDTLKSQLQEEKDMLLSKVDDQKDLESEAHDTFISQLETERDAVSEHYEEITNDEKQWAKIREELMKGNFSVVGELLKTMGIEVNQLADGTFDTMSEGFSTYSEEVRNFVLEINKMINEVNSMTNSAYGKTSNIGAVEKVSISEPINSYSVDELIRKAYGGEELLTPTADKKQLYDMIQGSDINEYRMGEIWRKAQSGIELDIPSPDHMEFYDMFEEILKKNKLKRFNTGGYTGNNLPSSGGLAILDNKELVLNDKQTSHILDAVKLMDKVKSIIPNINRSSMEDRLATTGEFTNNNNYEININIEKINGDKDGGKTVLKEIVKGMKKLGK